MKMENTDAVKLIEEKYDEFFGTGYWEDQYKKHIVAFAAKCFSEISCLEAKPKALHSMKEAKEICTFCGSREISWYGNDDDKTFFCFDCKKVQSD